MRRCDITPRLRKIRGRCGEGVSPAHFWNSLVSVRRRAIISRQKCIGDSVRVTRAAADDYIREFSEKSGEQWRLPTKEEFESIVEEHCDNPALNPNVFPNIEVNNYWLQEDSWHGSRFACSIYILQGSSFCRQPSDINLPILLIKE